MNEFRLKILRKLAADLDDEGECLGALDPDVVEIFGTHYMDAQGATTGRYGHRMGPAHRLLENCMPPGLFWRMDADETGCGEHRVAIYRVIANGGVRQVIASSYRKDDLAGGIVRTLLAAMIWHACQPDA